MMPPSGWQVNQDGMDETCGPEEKGDDEKENECICVSFGALSH